VGYVVCGVRDVKDIRLGDTLYGISKSGSHLKLCEDSDIASVVPLRGFRPAQSVVFAGMFPTDSNDFESLSLAVEKLLLSDASVVVHKESSDALGELECMIIVIIIIIITIIFIFIFIIIIIAI
jgi:translation elongation factor EF-4